MSFSTASPSEQTVLDEPRRSTLLARRAATGGFRWLARSLCTLCLLGLIGYWIRGRSVPLEMLLYIPLVPLGALATLMGLGAVWLRFPREGVSIALVGLLALLVAGNWMRGRGPGSDTAAHRSREPLRLMHWNVLWGGYNDFRGGWKSIVDEILAQSPDIIVLSESPGPGSRRVLLERLGKNWTAASVGSPLPHVGFRYEMVILSRWPIRIVSLPLVSNGTAVEAIVDHPSRQIRILAIDGKSRPTIPRSPMLREIASILDRSAKSRSSPIDVVVGDFNCVGRTRGFDDLRAAGEGYALASEAATGWRATWPSWFPIYDIDHLWLRNAIAIRSCRIFSRLASDHRGQLVELLIDPTP